MNKSLLQEVCQKRGWGLPQYSVSQTGPDHIPRFTASVEVKGGQLVFETPNHFTSSKEAQNNAAYIALNHINAANPIENPPNPNPNPNLFINVADKNAVAPLPTSGLGTNAVVKSDNGEANMVNAGNGEASQKGQDNATCYRVSVGIQDKAYKDTLHMHKNRLQKYAQKNNFGFPVYTAEFEGPPHNRRFKSRVSLDGKSYETLEFFTTLKEAEQAAAKVACQLLSFDANQEDGRLYKNLVQELAGKMNFLGPYYETASCVKSHKPVFVSSVKVGSDTFRGGEAFTKKQAEMNAAKVAYLALSERCQAKASASASSIASIAVNGSLTQHQEATYEEGQPHAKKLKSGDKTENTGGSPGPSNIDLSENTGGNPGPSTLNLSLRLSPPH